MSCSRSLDTTHCFNRTHPIPLSFASRTPRRPVPSGVMTDPTARLRALVENGVAKRFDLRAWSAQSSCARARAIERLETLLEQARPDVIKLIVMESLQGTPESDLDVMVYGECAPRAFLEFINVHARTLALERAEEGDETRRGDARGTASTRAALTYYDLGSGAGKSVLTAALSPYFARCRGIELLPCVHAIAEILVEDFSRDVAPRDDGVSPSVSVSLGDIFVDLSWIDADFVFCNCVTWDEATMARLASHAAKMRRGALFVTALCPLPSDAFEVVAEDEIDFSWGRVDAIVHRKT